MKLFTSLFLVFLFSITAFSAQLPNRSFNCSKSFSSEYENLFSKRQRFEKDLIDYDDFNCSQKNSNHDESWEWSDKALMTWNDDLNVNNLSMQTIMK